MKKENNIRLELSDALVIRSALTLAYSAINQHDKGGLSNYTEGFKEQTVELTNTIDALIEELLSEDKEGI